MDADGHRRARAEDDPRGRGERRDPAGVGRPARRRVVASAAGDPRHRQRRLHPHDPAPARGARARLRAGDLRPRLHLRRGIRGAVLRRLRGVQARERDRRRHRALRGPQGLRHPLEAPRAAAGEELLLQAQRVPGQAARALPGPARLRASRVGQQRGRLVRLAGTQGPLDLALDLRLGHHRAVGRVARHLRVDRRAPELRDGRGLRLRPGAVRAPLAGRARRRQGHPALPRRHLARHADGRRPRGAALACSRTAGCSSAARRCRSRSSRASRPPRSPTSSAPTPTASTSSRRSRSGRTARSRGRTSRRATRPSSPTASATSPRAPSR